MKADKLVTITNSLVEGLLNAGYRQTEILALLNAASIACVNVIDQPSRRKMINDGQEYTKRLAEVKRCNTLMNKALKKMDVFLREDYAKTKEATSSPVEDVIDPDQTAKEIIDANGAGKAKKRN